MSKSSVLPEEDIVSALGGATYEGPRERCVKTLEEAERDHLWYALETFEWCLGKTCEAPRMSRPTLGAKRSRSWT